MFGKKKLAKRSIVGTRVSALSPRDGRFYSGTIQSQVCEETVTSSAVYVVRFDNGVSYHIKARSIIGPGFQPVSSAILKRGQKVFLTLNGREVSGVVLGHDRVTDEVVVGVKTPCGEDFETTRRLEEIRVLESRKSARLVDQADVNYSKLADFQLNSLNDSFQSKRRTPSHVIDVPTASTDKNERSRRQRRSPEEMLDVDHGEDLQEVVTMDETIAAMVLTSLSVSPSSPSLTSPYSREYFDNQQSCPDSSHLPSSVDSSGFYSGHSERDDQSPPLPPLSESAPAIMGHEPPTLGSDDDSSNSSGRLLINEEPEDVIFKCTWRGCTQATSTRNAIERHIRRAHFDRDSDLELTDNEEDFHYMEEDVGSQSISMMTKSFAAMQTSSPSECHRIRHVSEESHVMSVSGKTCETGGLNSSDTFTHRLSNGKEMFDHDYQRKILRQSQASSVPIGGTIMNQGQTTSLPIAIDEDKIQRSLSWHIHSSSPGALVSPPQRPNKLTIQERLHQHQAQSPKSSIASSSFKVTQHRRARSEVRKCRKVYGMENRDQWCTQCKWKKACTRFVD